MLEPELMVLACLFVEILNFFSQLESLLVFLLKKILKMLSRLERGLIIQSNGIPQLLHIRIQIRDFKFLLLQLFKQMVSLLYLSFYQIVFLFVIRLKLLLFIFESLYLSLKTLVDSFEGLLLSKKKRIRLEQLCELLSELVQGRWLNLWSSEFCVKILDDGVERSYLDRLLLGLFLQVKFHMVGFGQFSFQCLCFGLKLSCFYFMLDCFCLNFLMLTFQLLLVSLQLYNFLSHLLQLQANQPIRLCKVLITLRSRVIFILIVTTHRYQLIRQFWYSFL